MTYNNKCELLSCCEFFDFELKSSKIADRFKQKYCNNCKDACARYMVARSSGLDSIPKGLYPNEYDKALQILENGK